jgi:hypothetical protein
MGERQKRNQSSWRDGEVEGKVMGLTPEAQSGTEREEEYELGEI